jgi:hypothetical protein
MYDEKCPRCKTQHKSLLAIEKCFKRAANVLNAVILEIEESPQYHKDNLDQRTHHARERYYVMLNYRNEWIDAHKPEEPYVGPRLLE